MVAGQATLRAAETLAALLKVQPSFGPERAMRYNGFLSSEIDPRTQIGYATNAIQEGGFFGVGVGEGSVKWSLPDAHTDFIIAVAAEEYGFIMVLAIILLYATVVGRSLVRLTGERDPFVRIAGTGLACAFGVQALINMGVNVGLLPTKGLTLPFMSYGGSGIIANLAAMAVVLRADWELRCLRRGVRI